MIRRPQAPLAGETSARGPVRPRPGAPPGQAPRRPATRRPVASRMRDEMTSGLVVSAVLHTAALVAIMLGLPELFRHPPPEETSIAVQLINISNVTTATAKNPTPTRTAKIDTPPPPVPVEKPEPPKQDPLTPPPPPAAAEPSPPPPPPPPKPEPPKPEPPPPAPPPPPPPAPIPKPEPPPPPPPPKPEPPKPEQKPEPPKPAPKPEPPKKQPDNFDQLLKNLSKQQPAPKPDQTPQKPQKPQPQSSQLASAMPNAPLGSQITTSEKDAIASAVEACWDFDAGAKGASDMRAVIRVELNPDGSVRNTSIVDSEGRGNDPEWRAFAERARRAPLIAQCNKLPIPPEKYDQLKVFTFTFTPKGVS
ncbi:MAG TPA: cell envelope integrity protein TolA [Aliidongia sp.]|nr:cell envelope integrity protein TolA [Aliidongia sp.]